MASSKGALVFCSAALLLIGLGPALVAAGRGLKADEVAPSGCTRTHPLVGASGPLTTRFHEVSGTVTVVDDCTFKVENFSHDGVAPAVYWWGNDDTSTAKSALRAGKRVVKEMVPYGDGTDTYVGTLESGVTWDGIQILYAWCEAFDINFGDVALTAN